MLFSLLLVAASISLCRHKVRTISSPPSRSPTYSLWGFSKIFHYILLFVFPFPSFSFVEFLPQLDDSHKSLASEVLTGIYDSRDLLEQRKVLGLRFGLKGKPFEKRKYLFYELDVIRHDKVMDSIASPLQSAALQIFLQEQKIRDISLSHIEREHYLPLEFMVRSLAERDIEAPFSITESRQIPSQILRVDWRCVHTSNCSTWFCESFLLIVRTSRFSLPFRTSTWRYSEFPAFGRIL